MNSVNTYSLQRYGFFLLLGFDWKKCVCHLEKKLRPLGGTSANFVSVNN